MRKKSPRYFGMSQTQIGILVGAASVAFLLVCGIFLLILLPPNQDGGSVATIASPTLVLATDAPVIIETLTATPPPTTEIATSAPPAGWIQFQTKGATIWLPASFVGGDLVNNKQQTINKINRLGSMYRNAVGQIKKTDKEVVLWAVDKTPKITDVITTVIISHHVITEDLSIDDYIQNGLSGDINGTPVAMLITVNTTKKMVLLGRETRQLTYSQYLAGHEITGVAYYIKDGADIWIVDYNLIPWEYMHLLPIVEQSIQTFNITK